MDVAVRTTDLPLAGEQLTVLYREHAGPLYGYARYLTESAADAEDLVQVTFMQAYGALERGQELEHPRAWLMTTLRRRALNLARDRHDLASDELGTLASITDVSSSAAMNEQLAAVRTALERLPESQRHAFVLRHWSGLSAGEIAEVMDTSEPSVQSLLSRARSALRADRQLKRAADAVTGMVFIPSSSVSDNLSELVPGFGGGGAAAGAGTVAASAFTGGKMTLALKGALAVVAATGVVAVGHERHLDSRALQAVGIEQSHHHGRGADDRAGSDDHGGARGSSGQSGRGGDDHGTSGSGRGSGGPSGDSGSSGKGQSGSSGKSVRSGSSGSSGRGGSNSSGRSGSDDSSSGGDG